MKTASRILGIIVILIALLTCAMSIYRANLDKEETVASLTEANAAIAKLKQEGTQLGGEAKTYIDQQIAEAEKMIAEAPSASTYTILSIFLGVLLVLALAFGVFLFRPNLKLVQQLLIASVIILVVTYFMSPDIKRGTYGGMESRTLALISGIPVVLAGVFALLVAKKSNPNTITQII